MSSIDTVANEETDEDTSGQDPVPVLEREVGPPSHPKPIIQPGKLADFKSYGDNLGNVMFVEMHPDQLLGLKLERVTNPHERLQIINTHTREVIAYRIAQAQHTGMRFDTPNGALRSFVNETDARYFISNIMPKPTQEERPAEDAPNTEVEVPPIHKEPPPPEPSVIPKTNEPPKSRPVPEEDPVLYANVNKLLMEAAAEMEVEEEEKKQRKALSRQQRRSRKRNKPQKISNDVEEEDPAPTVAPIRAPIHQSVHTPIKTSILAPLRTPVNDNSLLSNNSHRSVSFEFGEDQRHGSGQESVRGDGVSPNSEEPESPADRNTDLESSSNTTVVNKDTKQADEYIGAASTEKRKDSPSVWTNKIVPLKPEGFPPVESPAPTPGARQSLSMSGSTSRPSVDVSVERAESEDNHQNADTSTNMDTTEKTTTPKRKLKIGDTPNKPIKKRLTEADLLMNMDFGPKEGGKLGDMEIVRSAEKRRRTTQPAPELPLPARKMLPRRGAEKEKVVGDAGDEDMEEEEEEKEMEEEQKDTPGTSNGSPIVKVTSKRGRKSVADDNEKAAKTQKRSESKNEDRECEKESPVEKEPRSERKKNSVEDDNAEIPPVLTPIQRSPEPSSILNSKSPPNKKSAPRNYQAKMFEIAPATPQFGSYANPIVLPEDTPEPAKTSEPVRSSPANSPSGPTTSSIQMVNVHHFNQPRVVPKLLPVQTVQIPKVHHRQLTPAARRSNQQPAVMNIPPFQAAPPPHNNSPLNSPSISVHQAIRAQQGLRPPRPLQYPMILNPAQSYLIAPILQSIQQQQPYPAQQYAQQIPHVQHHQYQPQHQPQQQEQLQHQQPQRHIYDPEEPLRHHQQRLKRRQRKSQQLQQHQRLSNPPRPTYNGIPPYLAGHPVITIPDPARPVVPIADPARPVVPIAEPVRPAEPELREDFINKNGKIVIPPNCDHDYYNWKCADLSAWMKIVLNVDDTDPIFRKMIDEDIDGLVLEEFLVNKSACLTVLGVTTGQIIRIKSAATKVVNNRERIRYEIEMAEYNRQMRLYELQQRENIRN